MLKLVASPFLESKQSVQLMGLAYRVRCAGIQN